jgi:hypothetical protein
MEQNNYHKIRDQHILKGRDWRPHIGICNELAEKTKSKNKKRKEKRKEKENEKEKSKEPDMLPRCTV